MSVSTSPAKTREARPASSPSLPTPATPSAEEKAMAAAPVAIYWGDRFLLLFWLACFALMLLANLFDALAGLLGR